MSKNKRVVNLDELSKNDLIEIILGEQNTKAHNRISVADFEVESTVEPLRRCEETINKLIDKHKEFVTLRRAKTQIDNSFFSGSGYG